MDLAAWLRKRFGPIAFQASTIDYNLICRYQQAIGFKVRFYVQCGSFAGSHYLLCYLCLELCVSLSLCVSFSVCLNVCVCS